MGCCSHCRLWLRRASRPGTSSCPLPPVQWALALCSYCRGQRLLSFSSPRTPTQSGQLSSGCGPRLACPQPCPKAGPLPVVLHWPASRFAGRSCATPSHVWAWVWVGQHRHRPSRVFLTHPPVSCSHADPAATDVRLLGHIALPVTHPLSCSSAPGRPCGPCPACLRDLLGRG